jgi:peptidoglycan hydrolase-like protein with peptidoglycan-binding domain/methionine-rich copper-binding protein CopC
MQLRNIKISFVLAIVILGLFSLCDYTLAATNLLTNPGHETGDNTGWTGSVSVRTSAQGCPDWPSGSNAQCVRPYGNYSYYGPVQVYEGSYSLHFSYTSSISHQTINLTSTYTTTYLDTAPTITISDHVLGANYLGGGCGDTYRLRVLLKNGAGTTIATYDTNNSTATCDWQTLTNTFSGYGSGLRSIYFERTGVSSEFVQGAHGPAFDSASVYVGDITAPTVSYFNPADNSTGVGVNANFEVNFNEAIATSTGNIVLYKTSDDSMVETIDIAGPKVTASSTTALIVNPSTTLDSETGYYFMIDATAIDDTSGNSFAGITASTTWSFTTEDVAAPTVASLSPADDATDVALDANLVINFNEDIATSTGNIVLYKTSDDSMVETIDIAGPKVTASSTTALTINPTTEFDYETGYYVTIANTAVDDTSGNSFAGITALTTWSFTTLNTPTCPTIANASTYNSYPSCGVATCNSGYTLTSGACIANSGGGSFVSPSVPKVVIPPSLLNGSINSMVTNVYQMAISDSENFSLVSWQDYNESYKTNHKTLYIKFRSKDGGVSEVYVVNPKNVINNVIGEIGSSCVFYRDLEYGSEGEDVKELQRYLNNHGSRLADSGPGSPGNETIFFVNRTKSALIKFQTVNKLLVTGKFDQATKIFIGCIDEQKKSITTMPTESGTAKNIFTRDLQFGMIGNDVKELQKYLNNSGFKLAKQGAGALGFETNYFGALTQKALIDYQKSNNIFPANGYFGQVTRNLVNQ